MCVNGQENGQSIAPIDGVLTPSFPNQPNDPCRETCKKHRVRPAAVVHQSLHAVHAQTYEHICIDHHAQRHPPKEIFSCRSYPFRSSVDRCPENRMSQNVHEFDFVQPKNTAGFNFSDSRNINIGCCLGIHHKRNLVPSAEGGQANCIHSSRTQRMDRPAPGSSL